MAKYSYEFKKKLVEEYLNGEGSYLKLSRKHGLTTDTNLVNWVAAYKRFGDDGLIGFSCLREYPFEFKLHMVKLYLTTNTTYRELAFSHGMSSTASLSIWVNKYKAGGIDALRPTKKGQPLKMIKSKDIRPLNNKKTATDSEYLKKLEEENLQLRIENAYLKKLRRLRSEEKPQKTKRESSTASEENLD